MRKFSLSLLIVLCPVSVFATTIQTETITYTDVPEGMWFSGYVHDATTAGIVSGYKDPQGKLTGKFGPADDVTLGQALKIGVLSAGYDTDWYEWSFDHTLGTYWLSPYYTVASAEGFASFYFFNKSTDNPDAPATRAQVAQIIADAFKVNLEMPTANDHYSDVTVATASALAIEALSRDGVVSGDINSDTGRTHFRPEERINRAEMVKMAMKAREIYGEPKGTRQEGRESQIPTPIKKLCTQGHVNVLSGDWHETFYELMLSNQPVSGGTNELYDENAKRIGAVHRSDTPSFILNDGSSASCSFNGNACPEYGWQVC